MASTPIDTGLETRSITAPETILEMRSITKEFPGVKALADVSLAVRAGEIHAICGENGAGKSTLMKVLSGRLPVRHLQRRDRLPGEEVRFRDIRQSEQAGIVDHPPGAGADPRAVDHREPLPRQRAAPRRRHRLEAPRSAARWTCSARSDCDDDPDTQIKDLGVGKQQLVEIAKALAKDVKLLILDEPTAALNEDDSQHLLDLMRGF